MSALDTYGLTTIDNMPDDFDAGVRTAMRVDYLRQTNFGMTFDVISEKSPINLAYTSLSHCLYIPICQIRNCLQAINFCTF